MHAFNILIFFRSSLSNLVLMDRGTVQGNGPWPSVYNSLQASMWVLFTFKIFQLPPSVFHLFRMHLVCFHILSPFVLDLSTGVPSILNFEKYAGIP